MDIDTEGHILPSLWEDDSQNVDDFDPFEFEFPEDFAINDKLRYLFTKVVIQQDHDEWRSPDDDKMKIIALKCLYAAMIGFNKGNLSLLYPSGEMGHSLDELWLTKAQHGTDGGPSVRDRCCGHVFEKGETYYRCKYST